MSDTSPVLAEAHSLSRRLYAVAERAKHDFASVVAEHGLTPQQARTVLFLVEPRLMSALAHHLNCDASNVTGLADRLEAAGLLERIPGPDRRSRRLRLTDKGMSQRKALAASVAAGSTVTAKLTRVEQELLGALLDKLLAE